MPELQERELVPAPKPIPDYSRLSYTETGLVLKLSLEGLTQTQIAQRLDCSQSTVSDVLRAYQDTRELATAKLRNGSLKLAERVLSDADVDQSIDVLERIQVLEPKQSQSGTAGVQILIGMPAAAAGLDPILLVSDSGAGSHNDHYQTQCKSRNSTQLQALPEPAPAPDMNHAKPRQKRKRV